MAKSNYITNQTTASFPLTSGARETMLEDLFANSLPHYGELFIPDDGFYTIHGGPLQALHMLGMLCSWLGIKPGYIGLNFESERGKILDGQRYTINIKATVLHDEFLLGATLAHALTRYLIEERKQIHLSPADQAALLATASIVFGLGLIVLNGMETTYGRLYEFMNKLRKATVTGGISENFKAGYEYSLRGFIKTHSIDAATYSHTLTPWATKKLPVKPNSKPTKAVKLARHNVHIANLKLVGVGWLVLLTLLIGSTAIIDRVKPQSATVADAQAKADLLMNLTRECQDSISYQKQYADLTDIQTVRSLNAISLRCQGLNNQSLAAQHTLESMK